MPLESAGHAIGIDLGVTDFAETSDGAKIANPRHLARKARNLARAISDCGWGEFRRQLEYKCERYGRELVVIGRWPGLRPGRACRRRLSRPACRPRLSGCRPRLAMNGNLSQWLDQRAPVPAAARARTACFTSVAIIPRSVTYRREVSVTISVDYTN